MQEVLLTRRDVSKSIGATILSMTIGPTLFGQTDCQGEDQEARFKLSNRRYIGCKQKLLDWIFEKIDKVAPDAKSFFDVFSGTGVVANIALNKYDKVIINDFLYSNYVIYEAFFAKGSASQSKLKKIVAQYNEIDAKSLKDNYFSQNFGGKYFEADLAKLIGFIRDDIEQKEDKLTSKERSILLASLLYSIDSHANTCGHFEAYIKKPIPHKDFIFRLVDYSSFPNVEIYREDSNELANKVEADIAYIDPPYNSRQYSRFYHVYETLIKWDKPQLYGVAVKPPTENMSKYCRSGALTAFKDLIEKLKCKYLIVSYNNTYSSKSKSSENKISLEELQSALESVGETKVYTHKFGFFNAGKTDFDDHKEYLFVTKKHSKNTSRNGFVRSPFFYVGDKYKLLPSIVPLFPTNIETFVEPFVGGGSVALNVKAKKYLLNDIDANIMLLHKHLCSQASRKEEWFSEIRRLINQYGLSKSYQTDIIPEELKKKFVKTYFARYNKRAYEKLRDDYNKSNRTDKEALDRLYLLLIYGFNRMLRYNSKGNFNLPVGNVDFNKNVVDALEGYFSTMTKMDVQFYNLHFKEFFKEVHLTKNDFVYLDPPYLITKSEYNKIWTAADDVMLMNLLDELDKKGIKFAISNVTHYRGRINEPFLAWSQKYHVIPIKSNYINYHDNKEKAISEVLVMNYDNK